MIQDSNDLFLGVNAIEVKQAFPLNFFRLFKPTVQVWSFRASFLIEFRFHYVLIGISKLASSLSDVGVERSTSDFNVHSAHKQWQLIQFNRFSSTTALQSSCSRLPCAGKCCEDNFLDFQPFPVVFLVQHGINYHVRLRKRVQTSETSDASHSLNASQLYDAILVHGFQYRR